MPDLPPDWSIYLRLEGLASDGLPCSFGAIDIISVDGSYSDDVRNQLFENIDDSINSKETKDRLKQHRAKDLEQYFTNRVFARVSVQAFDEEKAFVLARRNVRLTVDVLNFVIYQYANSNLSFVYMPGEAQTILDLSLRVEHEHPPNLSIDPVGPLATSSMKSLQTTEDHLQLFARASSILKNVDQGANQIEKRLLTAMIWFGRAVRARTAEESFLMYTIALESLLLEKERSAQLTYRLRLSTAHSLGDSLDERKQISRDINRLYGIRSDIVHNGNIAVQEPDRISLCNYALACIVTLLSDDAFDRMKQFTDLQDWLDERILG